MAKMYIHSATGLQPLSGGSGEVTKEAITNALGYSPADEQELIHFEDDKSGDLTIKDSKGYIIAVVNSKGVHSVEFQAGDMNIKETLEQILATMSNIKTEEPDEELTIRDSKGNIILRVNADGLCTTNIKIDNGDVLTSKLNKKKISILGDSISTFNGYLPSGYETYYPKGDVTAVNQTWWKRVIDNTGMELAVNASYSGSSVQSDGSGIPAVNDDRIAQLGDPDIILVDMGINDAALEDLGALGDITKVFTLPLTESSAAAFDDTAFLGAYQAMLTKLMVAYPNAKIVCLGLNWTSNATSDNIVVATSKISELCELYGCEYIDVRKCGITPANMNTYLIDELHPNAAGHKLLADYITKQLQNIM